MGSNQMGVINTSIPLYILYLKPSVASLLLFLKEWIIANYSLPEILVIY